MYSAHFIRLLEKLEPSTREVLLALLEEIEKQREETVTRKEVEQVWEVLQSVGSDLKELAEAQKRTEQRVEELAEAQKRTEEQMRQLVQRQQQLEGRMDRLEIAMQELAEAQKRADQRIEELAEAQKRADQRIEELAEAQKRTERRVEELVEAQKRTERRLEELAEAQKRTEQRLEELAEAQKRTEQRVEELTEAQKQTEERVQWLIETTREIRRTVGALQHTVGYTLEDRAYVGLPKLLRQDFGIEVIGALDRDYVTVGRKEIEVNILGKGRKDGQELWIVGEAKTQVYERDIKQFERNVEQLKPVLGENLFLVVVGYQIPPKARRYLKSKGIPFYLSSKFPL